jgi:glycosyltransferase involved in cell wall biosynthesis
MIRVSVFVDDDGHLDELKSFFSGDDARRFKPSYRRHDVLLQADTQREMPHVILSVSRTAAAATFPQLCDMPVFMRRKWIHVSSPAQVCASLLTRRNFSEIMHGVDAATPLVSCFTTSFQSKSRILRPYKSLLAQTYADWEWTIVCDSPGDDNFQMLQEMARTDYRIQVINTKHCGMIGQGKRLAAMSCRGSILVELDHDDCLVPDALQRIVDVREEWYFLSSNWSEPFEESPERTHAYGGGWGHGWGSNYRVVHNGVWVNVAQSGRLNPVTIRTLVCAPNHLRAWNADFYRSIGGHNPKMLVADDMDLMVRTFLGGGRFVRIPDLLYEQFRNTGGSNFTLHFNAEIQHLVRELQDHYNDALVRKFAQLGVVDTFASGTRPAGGVPRYTLPDALSVPRLDTCVGVDARTVSIVLQLTIRQRAAVVVTERGCDEYLSELAQREAAKVVGVARTLRALRAYVLLPLRQQVRQRFRQLVAPLVERRAQLFDEVQQIVEADLAGA